jgi:hypothetical protein
MQILGVKIFSKIHLDLYYSSYFSFHLTRLIFVVLLTQLYLSPPIHRHISIFFYPISFFALQKFVLVFLEKYIDMVL